MENSERGVTDVRRSRASGNGIECLGGFSVKGSDHRRLWPVLHDREGIAWTKFGCSAILLPFRSKLVPETEHMAELMEEIPPHVRLEIRIESSLVDDHVVQIAVVGEEGASNETPLVSAVAKDERSIL